MPITPEDAALAMSKLQSLFNDGPVGRGSQLVDALINQSHPIHSLMPEQVRLVYARLPYGNETVFPERGSCSAINDLKSLHQLNPDLVLRVAMDAYPARLPDLPNGYDLTPEKPPITLAVLPAAMLGARQPVLDQLASAALTAAKSAADIEAAKMREAASHHSGIVDKLSALIGSGGLGQRTETTTDEHSQRSGPTGPENTVAAATFRRAVQGTLNIRPGQKVAHETTFKSAPIEVTAPYMAYAAFPDSGSTAQRSVSPTHAEVEIHGQGAVMGFAAQVIVKIGASEFITRTTIHG